MCVCQCNPYNIAVHTCHTWTSFQGQTWCNNGHKHPHHHPQHPHHHCPRGATQQSVDCESLTPTRGATQQSVDCESLTPARGATQQSVDCESLTPTQGARQQSVDSKIVPVSSIAPEGWGPKEGGNATSPLHSRGSPKKGTKSEDKVYARGHHDAPRNKAWNQRLSRFAQ